jgi:uncharacterized protein YbjT (DUF2867 family)
MTSPRILVTGASGKTGAEVVRQLREQGVAVRAMVRRQDERSKRLERIGADIVVADITDSHQLVDAMQAVTRAYYCAPFTPFAIQGAATFAVAAKAARLESIVELSQWLAGPSHPSLATRHAWLTGELFALSDIKHTVINPGFFADNYLRLIGFAAHFGILPSLTGDSRNAPPSNEDIARVAVAALLSPEQHAGKRYRPTGPQLLSTKEMAAILSNVLGRNVQRIEMPMWMFLKAARMQGVSAFELSGFRYYVQDHKQGAFELGAPTNDVFTVTGRPAEDFETIARRYAALPQAQRTISNSARAWFDFMRTPLSPGYNLDRFDRIHDLPPAAQSTFAMDDDNWRADRLAQHHASVDVFSLIEEQRA